MATETSKWRHVTIELMQKLHFGLDCRYFWNNIMGRDVVFSSLFRREVLAAGQATIRPLTNKIRAW